MFAAAQVPGLNSGFLPGTTHHPAWTTGRLTPEPSRPTIFGVAPIMTYFNTAFPSLSWPSWPARPSWFPPPLPNRTDNDSRAKQFIARHEATVRPLEIESSRCWWEANTTGSDAAFHKKEEIETRLNLLLANRETFAELKAIQAAADPRSAGRPANRRALSPVPGPADRPRADQGDVGPLQRRGKGLQRLPRQGRRQGADRERGPRRLADLEGLCPAAGGLGGEQGRGADPRART